MYTRFVAICSVFLLAFELTYASNVGNLQGSFLTWQVDNADAFYFPRNSTSKVVKIVLKFTKRELGSASPCRNAHSPITCSSQSAEALHVYFGSSSASQRNFLRFALAQFSCEHYAHNNPIINGYSESTLVLRRDYFYKIRYLKCCWDQTLNIYSSSMLNQDAIISFPTSTENKINSPVQLRFLPKPIIGTNERRIVILPVYDVDGDYISCTWANEYATGGGVFGSRIGSLSKSDCSLAVNGSNYQPGMYPVAVVIEDFKTSSMLVKYHSISVQFLVEIRGTSFTEEPWVNCSFINRDPIELQPLIASKIPEPPIPTYRPYTETDACSSYKNLSPEDRSVDYQDWSTYRCDMPLYGWYRFSGRAGSQMLDSCPALASSSPASCGSYYKGWIKDQAPPLLTIGSVNRSVCFSSPNSCACLYTRQIRMRNCGGFFVYFLDAVPACNARYCTKTDTSTTVYCSSNYMAIDLDASLYNASVYSSITLRSPDCNATESSPAGGIRIGTKLDSCSTSWREFADKIVYENQVILKPRKSGMITRHKDAHITFSCVFPNKAYVGTNGYELANEVNATEPGFGQFTLNLFMYLNGNYLQRHKSFPVSTLITDRLYFEAATTASDQYMILTDQCYSTPGKASSHKSNHTLISNRCSVSNNVLFYKTSRDKQRFSFPAREILENNPVAYVHCVVFLCHLTSNDSRCHSGCNGNNLKRTTRSTDSLIFRPSTVSKYYLLQVGAIEKEQDQSNDGTCLSGYSFMVMIIQFILHFPW